MAGCRVVYGVDPGLTTGVFCAARQPDGSTLTSAFQLGPEYGTTNHGRIIGSYLSQYGPPAREVPVGVLVSLERFIITAKTAQVSRQPDALDVIGAVRSECEVLENVHLVRYQSSEAKKFAPNATLKSLGWYSRGMRHANDGARHCLLAIAREEERWYHELMENVVL